jgi:hypothetical protein
VGWMTRCRGSCQHGCFVGSCFRVATHGPAYFVSPSPLELVLVSLAGAGASSQLASRRARAMSVRTPIPVPPGAT